MHVDVAPAALGKPSRRSLMRLGAAAGALVLAWRPAAAQAPEKKYGADGMPRGWRNDPHVFVAIAPDGIVTITCHRSEMGQGVRTGIPIILADEMEADWAKVRIAQAPGDEPRYGNQDTDGSRSTRHFLAPMRETGAAARMMLEAAAAKRWGVPVDQVAARQHAVVHAASGRSLDFGALAAEAMAQPVPPREALRLKQPADFRFLGKGAPRMVDGPAITTGRATYAQDVVLPGMLFAVVARPPVWGGKVASVDDSAARRVPGVKQVVPIGGTPQPAKFAPLGGIAVIADSTWAAMQGRDALKITWDNGPHGGYDSRAYEQSLREAVRKPAKVVRNDGDAPAALAAAPRKVTAEYYVPHLAHATMEPPSATARVADGKCEVWACVQSPYGTRQDVATALGLEEAAVAVNVTLLGGGFGRKSKCDFAIEAALLSRAAGGAPVKVVWTRQDDLHNGFYHTVNAHHMEAALGPDGKPTAWLHRSAFPTILSTFAPDPKLGMPLELAMGLIDTPFAIPNLRMENGEAEAHTRIGWFRAVSNIPHAFAVQSFAAELAHAAGRDPKDYLLELIGPPRLLDLSGVVGEYWNYGEDYRRYPVDTGRLRRVVEQAAQEAGWGRALPAREGLGIAVHRSFVSYVATVVHAQVGADGTLSIPRVDVAIDCGFAVNPDGIRKQVEGACVMGTALATRSAITYRDGRVQQSNFHDYLVTRIPEAPREVRVHIVQNGPEMPPGGVGEPGVPPFAPALCNAIFAATGKRIRDLPIGNQLKA